MDNPIYKNGYTSSTCQLALMELLESLFENRTFKGQDGDEALTIYRQDLPIPTDTGDEVTDTGEASAPFIIVHINGGSVTKRGASSPSNGFERASTTLQNIVSISLIICAYDADDGRQGWLDAENIKETILQKLCGEPYFGGAFTVILDTITWSYQVEDSSPYYFCGLDFDCTVPLVTQNNALVGLI